MAHVPIIARQEAAIAQALVSEWTGPGNVRALHAVYYVAARDEWRTAFLVQWKGNANFQCGVVRDVAAGGVAELKSAAMTLAQAVIFLGLHMVQDVVTWEAAL